MCLERDTLAIKRRFDEHSDDIQWISADNVSEIDARRLVVSYDVAQTAIVWELSTGRQISCLVPLESIHVAHWIRNGNVVFGELAFLDLGGAPLIMYKGNVIGEVILFEPGTGCWLSTSTIPRPITAIAPSSDCKMYALG